MTGRIDIGILGATGAVGQRMVQLLDGHPWFRIAEVAASERSSGKPYGEAANWYLPGGIPSEVRDLKVKGCDEKFESRVLFSGLDATVAGDIESRLRKAGHAISTNSRNHRMDPDVPLVIPEVNPEHLGAIPRQKKDHGGFIVSNPNCTVVGLTIPLAPLQAAFGIRQVVVVSMQASSGAGYPGVPSMDLIDNVIPHIPGEEQKIPTESLKILGRYADGGFHPAVFPISASVNRVPVLDGHTESIFVQLEKPARPEEVIETMERFHGIPQERKLPTAPEKPLVVFRQADRPQPRKDRDLGRGMTVSVGNVRQDEAFSVKFTSCSHNTIRGAAGAAILNAELLREEGYLE